jgi:hypothetical protein
MNLAPGAVVRLSQRIQSSILIRICMQIRRRIGESQLAYCLLSRLQ